MNKTEKNVSHLFAVTHSKDQSRAKRGKACIKNL